MSYPEIMKTQEVLEVGEFTVWIQYQDNTVQIKRTGGDAAEWPRTDVTVATPDLDDLAEVVGQIARYLRPAEPEEPEEPEEETTTIPGLVTGPGYKGLFYLECPECGDRFFAAQKWPSTKYTCHCGQEIKLEHLTRFESLCPRCSETTKGWTNTDADAISFPCKRCGGQVRAYYSPALDRHMSTGVAI